MYTRTFGKLQSQRYLPAGRRKAAYMIHTAAIRSHLISNAEPSLLAHYFIRLFQKSLGVLHGAPYTLGGGGDVHASTQVTM